jgi:Skp family chaperone for outer membrane proteins
MRGAFFMKQIALLCVLALAPAFPASSDDSRIARFDVQRVFDQYQHTKDIQKDIASKINRSGPQTTAETLEFEDHKNLIQRRNDLRARADKAPSGTVEKQQLDLQAQIATVLVQLDEAPRALIEGSERERNSKEAGRGSAPSQPYDARRALFEHRASKRDLGDGIDPVRGTPLHTSRPCFWPDLQPRRREVPDDHSIPGLRRRFRHPTRPPQRTVRREEIEMILMPRHRGITFRQGAAQNPRESASAKDSLSDNLESTRSWHSGSDACRR